MRLRRCRTSMSRKASSTPLTAPGLEAARSSPAHQALACASPTRLGAKAEWLAWGMVTDDGQAFPGDAGEGRKKG